VVITTEVVIGEETEEVVETVTAEVAAVEIEEAAAEVVNFLSKEKVKIKFSK
jgi:hypothetical protein